VKLRGCLGIPRPVVAVRVGSEFMPGRLCWRLRGVWNLIWPCSTSICLGWTGLEERPQLYAELPSCAALIVTGLSQPGHLLRALQTHVRGFLLKEAPAARLADAIRRVAAGEGVLDPDLVAAAPETGDSPLTGSELDVLRVSQTGVPTMEIAATLS
jgi:DNA-binding NarL/FixJ family response regulator